MTFEYTMTEQDMIECRKQVARQMKRTQDKINVLQGRRDNNPPMIKAIKAMMDRKIAEYLESK